MKTLLNILTCLIFVPTLQGCAVGVFAAHPKDHHSVSNPTIWGNTPESHEFYGYREETKISSCSQLLARWGKPDETVIHRDEKIFKYKYGLAWMGVGAFIGPMLPIPLIAPVGFKSVDIACKDDRIVRATAKVTAVPVFGCYYIFLEADCLNSTLRNGQLHSSINE